MQTPDPAPPNPPAGPPGAPFDFDAERWLIERLRAGDEAAFDQVVRANGGRLLATARRMLRSEEEARDAVQEAFLQAFRGLGGFQGEARLSTWLGRILVNGCLVRLRSRRRRPEIAIEDCLPRFLEDGHRADPGPGWDPSAITALESAQTRAFVRDQIDRLPEDYRNVLLLRDIQDLDTEETATILGISAGATKVRLHRARQALRALLDPHFTAFTAGDA
ncbi:MAG: sigma-70 family RNA polymerase sigma factor [Myxococcota bacterium]